PEFLVPPANDHSGQAKRPLARVPPFRSHRGWGFPPDWRSRSPWSRSYRTAVAARRRTCQYIPRNVSTPVTEQTRHAPDAKTARHRGDAQEAYVSARRTSSHGWL